MKAEYIDHMGDDLAVVNAARVSFDKESSSILAKCTCAASCSHDCFCGAYTGELDTLKPDDVKLINYLAKHNHWTPFAHTAIKLRMKAPIFVRTQCFKHKAGFVENEVSRRYVDSEPEFYVPDMWRSKPDGSVKQGSGDGVVEYMTLDCNGGKTTPLKRTNGLNKIALHCYNDLLSAGVAPEQARMVLPQSMYTEWVWTGNVASFARFCKQRTNPHAQKEIQELAQMASEIIQPLFPVSWAALMEV